MAEILHQLIGFLSKSQVVRDLFHQLYTLEVQDPKKERYDDPCKGVPTSGKVSFGVAFLGCVSSSPRVFFSIFVRNHNGGHANIYI